MVRKVNCARAPMNPVWDATCDKRHDSDGDALAHERPRVRSGLQDWPDDPGQGRAKRRGGAVLSPCFPLPPTPKGYHTVGTSSIVERSRYTSHSSNAWCMVGLVARIVVGRGTGEVQGEEFKESSQLRGPWCSRLIHTPSRSKSYPLPGSPLTLTPRVGDAPATA